MLTFCAMHNGMSIGNALIDSETSFADILPANVEIVAWTGKDGIREYNDRLRLTETFVDLVPYVPLVKAWLTAASAATLTLDQAKMVMKDLITALYISKRQMPINFGGTDYLANDDDVLFNAARSIGGGNTGLVGEINERLGRIRNQFDLRPEATAFRWVYGAHLPGASGSNLDAYPMFSTSVTGSYIGSHIVTYYRPQAYAPLHGWVHQWRDSGGQPGHVDIPSVSGASTTPVPWETVNGSSVTHTAANASALLSTILTRSQDLLVEKALKINAMLLLNTIPAVINYDVIIGW